MKKIIAQQIENECFDYEAYYDEDQAAYDMFWAGGNRDFCDFNADLKGDVEKALDNAGWDLENGIDEELSDEEKNEERLSICEYYFKSLATNELTEEQFYQLGELSINYKHCCSRDELDVICDALTILHGKKFVNGTIRGCSQGDWMEYIAPETMSRESINWIEAVLFATGTEFRIAEVELPDDFDMQDVDALIEKADECMDAYCDYTDLWREDDVKEWIANGASYGNKHFTKDDVVILEIYRSYQVTHHEYKIA